MALVAANALCVTVNKTQLFLLFLVSLPASSEGWRWRRRRRPWWHIYIRHLRQTVDSFGWQTSRHANSSGLRMVLVVVVVIFSLICILFGRPSCFLLLCCISHKSVLSGGIKDVGGEKRAKIGTETADTHRQRRRQSTLDPHINK